MRTGSRNWKGGDRLTLVLPDHISSLSSSLCVYSNFSFIVLVSAQQRLTNIFQSQIQSPRRQIDWPSLNEFSNMAVVSLEKIVNPKSNNMIIAWVVYPFPWKKRGFYRGHRDWADAPNMATLNMKAIIFCFMKHRTFYYHKFLTTEALGNCEFTHYFHNIRTGQSLFFRKK